MRNHKLETDFTEWVEKILKGEVATKWSKIKHLDIFKDIDGNKTTYIGVEVQAIDDEGVPWLITYCTDNGELDSLNVIELADRKNSRTMQNRCDKLSVT